MKFSLLIILLPFILLGQVSHDRAAIVNQLNVGAPLTEKVMSSRCAVLYSPDFSSAQIDKVHKELARTGIDAVAYFEIDRVFAGADVEYAFYNYFTSREIGVLIFIQQKKGVFQIMVGDFNGKQSILDVTTPFWGTESISLPESLQTLYRTALSAYKRQSLLIADQPETGLVVPVISGRRTEAFAFDLKVDKLAVRKFGNEALDRELEQILQDYPFKYAMIENDVPETDLRRLGFFYILCFANSRGPVVKELLGYDVSKAETALASVTYSDGVEQIKMIPSDIPIYKFYTRQVEFNNVFLGTKWDADVTWEKALRNFIMGLRREMRIN